MKRILLFFLLGFLSLSALAANQDLASLEQLARGFVQGELSQRPGASFKLGHFDRRLVVPACPDPQVGWSNSAVPTGNTYLDLSCFSPSWRLRLPVSIKELRMGLVLTRPMQPGDVLGEDDVRLAQLPDGVAGGDILTDPSQVVGQALTSGAGAGIWLRSFMVRPPIVVKMNQRVRVVVSGDGFDVEAEGTAIANGRAGDIVPVRMPNGQVLRGTVDENGIVNLPN
jgi:flagella basal body P-ring formation protein FlgA